jgi:hypothetical protein
MSAHTFWALVAALLAGAIAVLALLPDPSQPTIIALGSVLGSFIAATIARLRSSSQEQLKEAALDGAYYGTALGIVAYLAALASGLS